MSITHETRHTSWEDIQPQVGERQRQCLRALEELGGQATANELAMHLFNQGKVARFDRNYVHPRLTELVRENQVIVVGRKLDKYTGRTVGVYALPGESQGRLF